MFSLKAHKFHSFVTSPMDGAPGEAIAAGPSACPTPPSAELPCPLKARRGTKGLRDPAA